MLLGFQKDISVLKDLFKKSDAASRFYARSGLKGDNLCVIICHAKLA
jgi:hypothetical protein